MKKTLAKKKISSLGEPSNSEEGSIADPKNALNEQEGKKGKLGQANLKTPATLSDKLRIPSLKVEIKMFISLTDP